MRGTRITFIGPLCGMTRPDRRQNPDVARLRQARTTFRPVVRICRPLFKVCAVGYFELTVWIKVFSVWMDRTANRKEQLWLSSVQTCNSYRVVQVRWAQNVSHRSMMSVTFQLKTTLYVNFHACDLRRIFYPFMIASAYDFFIPNYRRLCLLMERRLTTVIILKT